MTFQVVVTNAVWCCVTMTAGEVMGLQECVCQAMELISVLQKESVSPAAFLKLSVFSMGGKTGDMAGAKTVCCLSVTLGILSENIVQQLEKAISDIAGIAGIPFTDAVINQYHNF